MRMKKNIDTKNGVCVLIIISSIVIGYTICAFKFFNIPIPKIICCERVGQRSFVSKVENIEKFSSEEDFKNYLKEAENFSINIGFGGGLGLNRGFIESVAVPTTPLMAEEKSIEPERISETNVQVAGIDEPDIIKTDGKEIYFSPTENYYWRWSWGVIPEIKGETKAIKAFPPEDLAIEAEIDKSGKLLLADNFLIIFSNDRIYGYDIIDPEVPQKKWTMEIKDRSLVTAARLYENKIYLVTQTIIDVSRPCPIEPLSSEGVSLKINCVDVYHPTTPVQTDVTYNILTIDPFSGKVEQAISFVGSSGQSVVYMSQNGIFITYSYSGDFVKFYLKFFKEKCSDVIPDWLIEKTNKLIDYDLSESSKINELQVNFQKYYGTLSNNEKLRVENELNNRMSDYYKDNKRELEKTGIIKIGLDNFGISASGNVPGRPLNQFSLDEHQGQLRMAVTVGEGFFGLGFSSLAQQLANDVYILDKDLKIIGSVKDLGLEERIYSARFIEDKGYLVTFRQIDPFYVLDLSDPRNPELKGELKIPGYSSYLHPITKDKILGIGKEDAQVKISLFNVEDPAQPLELAKYTLNEYWSDILNTHHAFLLDNKHQIFFLPGNKGGYIFSCEGKQLKLIKAISGIQAKRAIYLDDYLYIIGEDRITVFNELNWTEVNKLEL